MSRVLFNAVELDQPRIPVVLKDINTYLIVGSPRTGSTLLCSMLALTAKYGIPYEYFNPGAHIAKRLSCLTEVLPRNRSPRKRVQTDKYLNELLALRTTQPNMAWGVKTFVKHFAWMYSCSTGRELVHQSKFIHIERRDKLDLAVSMHIAMQTGKWSTLTKRTAEPDPVEYNFNAIQHFYNLAHSQEGYWSALESKLGLDFHRIFYEDLVFDPLTVGNGLMKFLTGVESQIDFSTDPEVVKLEPQAHELNARFKLQFLNDLDFSKDKTIGWFR